VQTLKRDVEIHKQVEQELAKRSHFLQKLVKKLSARTKELEDENESLQKNENQNQSMSQSKDMQREERNKEEIIQVLEDKLESVEKKLARLQND